MSRSELPQQIGFTFALKRVWLWTVPMGAYSTLALFKQYPPFSYVPNLPFALEAGLTIAIGTMLVFRVNRAYERWWEARTLWGTLVNVSRNLAVKIRTLVQADRVQRSESRRLIVGFALALKDHLRDGADLHSLPGFADCADRPHHIPSYLMRRLYSLINEWKQEKRITDTELWVLDTEARMFLEVCGACERIKYTLMSQSWRTLTRQCVVIYLLVIPWALVDEFHIWTVPITMLISYFVIGGEGIAHYVEEPFGNQEDHLDLDAICHAIESTVSEILDDRE
jgi:putative membrane protein